MTFLIRPGTPRYREQLHARAFDAWRMASSLVNARWDLYTAAERSARAPAFAAYRDALDHEADAAAALEGLSWPALAEAA
jgi:hypothetical protein